MKLNLGCGAKIHSDWINVDFYASLPGVIAHDLRKPLPFRNETACAIYHSHVLEHFEKGQAGYFLGECFRVLKKGGILRVVVPDLEGITRSYLTNLERAQAGDREARERYEWTVIELIDQIQRNFSGGEMGKYWNRVPMPAEDFVISRVGSEMRGYLATIRECTTKPLAVKTAGGVRLFFARVIRALRSISGRFHSEAYRIGHFRLSGEAHLWMYDAYSLRELLLKAGFSSVQKCTANKSQIADFNSYLLDIEPDGSTRKPDSLFMEALK